jgi:hypothetical protein
MIKHIVIWKVKEPKEDIGKKVKEILDTLPSKIAEIKDFEVGINYNDSDRAWDVSLYSSFNNKADLDIYQNHPAHIIAKDYIVSVATQSAVSDYQV